MRSISRLRWALGLPLLWIAAEAGARPAAADVWSFAPAPAWVEPAAPQYQAPSPAGELSEGSWFLMNDRQIDVQPDGDDSYSHIALKVINAEGVKAQSQFDLEVDPSYQTLRIHTLRLVRDGRPIDQRRSARITALPQETELEQHIYNGNYNVNVLLADVRVGDVIEYDYSIHSHEWLMPGHYARNLTVGWSDPVQWQRVRLRYPAGRALRYRFTSGAIAPEERRNGAHSELVFR